MLYDIIVKSNFEELKENDFFSYLFNDADFIISHLQEIEFNHNKTDYFNTDKLFAVGLNKITSDQDYEKTPGLVKSYLDWSFKIKSKSHNDYPKGGQLIAKYSKIFEIAQLIDGINDNFFSDLGVQGEVYVPNASNTLHDFYFTNLKVNDKYNSNDIEVRFLNEFKKATHKYADFMNPGIIFEDIVNKRDFNSFNQFIKTVKKYYDRMHALTEDEKLFNTKKTILKFAQIADYGKETARADYERLLPPGRTTKSIPILYSMVYGSILNEDQMKTFNSFQAKKLFEKISLN